MANKKIQGITIELDAEVQPLQNALSKLNKEIKSVGNDITQINKALKLDPGNVDLVNRKMELLSEQAELSAKKTEALQQAQDKMDASGIDKSTKGYKDLQTQLAQSNSELKQITKNASDTSREFDQVTEGTKLLNTYLEATGKSLDDLKDTTGLSKLVSDFDAGSLGAQGFDKVLKAVAQDVTGSAKRIDDLKTVLRSVDDGGSLDKVRRDLDTISKTKISSLGVDFDALTVKSKDLEAELKQIDQALKLDPSSLELCAQKETVLAEATQTTEQRLAGLKQKFDELRNSGLDLNDEELREYQREISNLEAALSGYKTQAADLANAQQRLDTYFAATGTSIRDFANVLGTELVAKIESGRASSQELALAFDKIGQSATSNRTELDQLKTSLDSLGSGVSLENIRADLGRVGQEAQSTDTEVDELGQGFSELGSKLDTSNLIEGFEAVTDAVGAVIDTVTGFSGSAVDASSQVQDSLSQIKMQLGATDEEAKRISEAAQNVYFAGYGESIDDCSEAAILLTQNIDGITPDNLVNMTEKAISLAQALGVDNTEAIRGLRGAMAGFGVDANEAFDVFAVAQQRGLNLSQEMLDNIAEYAPRWKDSGVSMEEYFSLFEAGMATGAYSSDKVLDFLNEFKTSLDDGRIEAAIGNFSQGTQELFYQYKAGEPVAKECLQAITGELGNMENQSQAATLASEMWSSLGEDNAMAMITAMSGVTNSYTDVAGASQKLVDDNSNSVTLMSRKWEEFQMALAPIGEALAGIANNILDSVMPAVKQFGEMISGLFSGDISMSDYFDQVVAGYDSLISTIKEKFPEWKDSAIEAIKNFADGFFEAWPDVLSKIGELLGEVLPDLVTFIAEAAAAIVQAIGEHAPEILNGIAELLGNLIKGILEHLPDILQAALQLFMSLMTAIQQIQPELLPAVAHLVELIIQGLGSALGGIWEVLKNFFADLWNQTGPAFQPFADALVGAWNGIWTTIQGAWNAVVSWFSGIFSGIGETVGGAWNGFCTGISDAWNAVWSGLQAAWEGIVSWFSSIFGPVQEGAGQTWAGFTQGITDAWNGIWSGIQTAWETVTGWFSTVFGPIQEGAGAAWSTFTQSITDAWNNIWTGIQAAWETVSGWFGTAFEGVSTTVGDIWNGFTGGITETWNTMTGGVQEAWQGAKDKVAEITGGLVGDTEQKTQNIAESVNKNSQQMSDYFQTHAGQMDEQGRQKFTELTQGMNNLFQQASSDTDATWGDIETAVKEKEGSMDDQTKQHTENMLKIMKQNWDEGHRETDSKWDQIKNSVSDKITQAKDTAEEKVNQIRDAVTGAFNDAKDRAIGAWEDLKRRCGEIWENIKRTVSDAIERLKGFFNFNWELPQIKLPHFNISGSFSLNPPSVPSFSIDWYKKGGILTAPTIFGSNGNTLLGGGEAGAEAVLPVETMRGYVREETESVLTPVLDALLNKLDSINETNKAYYDSDLSRDTNVVMDTGALVGQLARPMDERLGRERKLTGRR